MPHYDKLPWYRRLVDAWRLLNAPRYALGVFSEEGHSLTFQCTVNEAAFVRDKLQAGISETIFMESAVEQAKTILS
ncbi:hypothetical protein [Hymenobacter koreensis]|uniref:Uncharacterized protein n=1 Tax=Hymenobacter koreensis TaxID=1084523 RepID=A0ABP8JNK7_9BACT